VTASPKPDLKLDARLMAIVEQDYPRYSAGEMTAGATSWLR
jgi:hypothetical protein